MKDIRVLYINYVIFAPDSISYNEPSRPNGPDLDQSRKNLNNAILGEVKSIVDAIDLNNSNIQILVNGYSNPSIPKDDPRWEAEVGECQWISNARAEEVTGAMVINFGVPIDLITFKGYGGTQTVVTYNPGNLASAELNRRVEVIVIEIVQ